MPVTVGRYSLNVLQGQQIVNGVQSSYVDVTSGDVVIADPGDPQRLAVRAFCAGLAAGREEGNPPNDPNVTLIDGADVPSCPVVEPPEDPPPFGR